MMSSASSIKLAIPVLALVVGGACSALTTDSSAPISVASVAIVPANSTIVIGGIMQLTATLMDSQGRTLAGSDIAWSSSAPSIATVSATGVMTGVSAGSAVITASASGKAATAVVTVTSTTSGGGSSAILGRIDVAPVYGAYVVGDTGTFAFLPLAGDGRTVIIPPGSFGVSASSNLLAGGPTQCSSAGCTQRISAQNLANGQVPRLVSMTVFPSGSSSTGPVTGVYRALVISNVLDSLALVGPDFQAGQRYTPPMVSVGSGFGVYPYVFYNNGSYSQATNAEYTVVSGTADLRRCTSTVGTIAVQAYCITVTPRAAGTITVQARLKKSDGTFWTANLSFTAR
jgi:hypothetical protein